MKTKSKTKGNENDNQWEKTINMSSMTSDVLEKSQPKEDRSKEIE